MRILIAPDKFKGSLSAARVASIVATELRGVFPDWGVDLCPIADGGEGTAEALTTAQNGTWVQIPTRDAQNRPLVAQYGLTQENGRLQAVMEMSAASGLALVSDLPLSPSTASTYGTGLMMLDAIERGASRILIGIGGSATNDAGTGMAAALGFRFLDENGRDLEKLPADLLRLKNILPPAKWPVDVLVACDVTNPLLGPEGCTRIYGPQKGIHDFEWFESRLQHLTSVVQRDLGLNPAEIPGAGAAGGLGYGLMTFCGARLVSGFDLIADLTDLRPRIAAADLIITGEGRLDAQTLHGKGPMGVAKLAHQLQKPIIGIAGLIEARDQLAPHFSSLIQVKPDALPVAEAIQRGPELLAEAVRTQLVAAIKACSSASKPLL